MMIVHPGKFLVAGLVVLAAFSIGSGTLNAAERKKVTLAQNLTLVSAVTIVAKNKGLFEKHGLDVEVRNLTSGKLALDAVLGGGADFSTVAETPLMRAGLVKQPIAIVATMESSDNDVRLIVRNDRGIRTLKDLKGKTIATFMGTSAEFFTVQALRAGKLEPADVKLVNLRPQDMAAALERGDIDGYAIWEPHIYKGNKLLGTNARILDTKGVYVETFNIAVMRQYLQQNPDTVRRFLRALLEAEDYIDQHGADTEKIVSDAAGLDTATFAAVRPHLTFRVALEPVLLEYMIKEAEWDISTGKASIGQDLKKAMGDLIAPDILRSIAPDRVKFAQ